MDNEIKKYLFDINNAVSSIDDYLGDKRDFTIYSSNKMLRRAIEREFEIIGEAMNRINKLNPDIQITSKKKIISMRNHVIHGYDKIDDGIFNNLLRQGNKLFVDFLIISEVINRVVRIEHKKMKPALKFKDFRNSQDGKDVLEDIYIIVKNDILNRFNVVGRSFDKQIIKNFLIVDELDFIDKAIASVCSEHELVLLTNDKDFKNSGLDILTGNPRILD